MCTGSLGADGRVVSCRVVSCRVVSGVGIHSGTTFISLCFPDQLLVIL